MEIVLFFFKQLLIVLLGALDLAMLVRAILSWIDPMREGRLAVMMFSITEPLILPFRKLCAKYHWFEGSPMDFPFLMTLVALMILQLLVEMI